MSLIPTKYATSRQLDLDPTGKVIKATAGILHGWALTNNHTAIIWVKFYNKATAPDENDTPVLTVGVSPTGDTNVVELSGGIDFGTGISWRCTTGKADSDTTDVADMMVANAFYV